MFFLKNYAENKAERLFPDLFLLFKKTLYEVKTSGQHLCFNSSWWSLTKTNNKKKRFKISDC